MLEIKIPTIEEEREYVKQFEDINQEESYFKKNNFNFVMPEDLKKEYRVDLYRKAEKELKAKISLIERRLRKLKLKHGEYIVILSQYGPGGTFMDNTVTIRINNNGEFSFDPVENIIHEVIHIQVNDLVKNLSREAREEIIDLMTKNVMNMYS